MNQFLCIGLGGAAGAIARYLVVLGMERCAGPLTFPWAILAVNLAGCYLIGLVFGFGEFIRPLPETLRHALVTGFLGSLTTFSTFSLQGLGLWEQGKAGQFLLYVGGSVAGGLLLAWIGIATAEWLS